MKDRNEVQKDHTLIRRLQLILDFHRGDKSGVRGGDDYFILGRRGQEGCFNLGRRNKQSTRRKLDYFFCASKKSP